MKLVLTEEEQFLKDTAKNFADERSPLTHFRALRDNNDPLLWDKDLWSEMTKLGWPGILIPEEYGGTDFGITGISVILNECAKTLTPSPLFATGVIGAYAITNFGTEEQKQKYLPKIASGELTTALAVDESSHHNPADTEVIAKKESSKFIINGKKIFVVDGASADLIILLARTSGNKGDMAGLTLFLINSDTKGVNKIKLDMADSRNYANINFNEVEIPGSNILGDLETGGETVEDILDIGRITMASEMLGSAEAAFEMTLDYLKQRKQFGALIGSFQALQHRAAEMYSELELTKSSVIAACNAVDENSNDLKRMASLGKYKAGETNHLVTNEAVQMHGGVGVTDEYDVGLYLKRARVTEQIFGNSEYHLDRYATLSEY